MASFQPGIRPVALVRSFCGVDDQGEYVGCGLLAGEVAALSACLAIGVLFISISATVTRASLRGVILPALGLVACQVLLVRPPSRRWPRCVPA